MLPEPFLCVFLSRKHVFLFKKRGKEAFGAEDCFLRGIALE